MDIATVFLVGSTGGFLLSKSRLVNRRQDDGTEGLGFEFKSDHDFGYQFRDQVPFYQEEFLGSFNNDVSQDTLDVFTKNIGYLREEEFRTPHHTLDPYKRDRGIGTREQRTEWDLRGAQ